ncbi:MAG: hypothetical protein ABSE55_08385 [Terracidiphilus sp.]|jgi:hypothetical protein
MPASETIRSMLAAGRHPLSVGRAREVAALILAHPKKMSKLVEYLWDEDPGVANRAADALERASCRQPSLAAPWKDSLLGLLAETEQNKLRWNLALIVPRLTLTASECRRAASILRTYLEDKSSIVKTCAMQGLAELTCQDSSLLPEVLDLLRILTRSGTPAMRARGRVLLRKLEAPDPSVARFRKTALAKSH